MKRGVTFRKKKEKYQKQHYGNTRMEECPFKFLRHQGRIAQIDGENPTEMQSSTLHDLVSPR